MWPHRDFHIIPIQTQSSKNANPTYPGPGQRNQPDNGSQHTEKVCVLRSRVLLVYTVVKLWNCFPTQFKPETQINHDSLLPLSTCTNADMYLGQQNRRRKVIRGDGNCFFRAVAHVTHGSEDGHAEVRKYLTNFLDANRAAFEKYIINGSWEEHISAMKLEGTWATQVELYAAATYFQVPLYLCSPHPATKRYSWLLFNPDDQAQIAFQQSKVNHIELCHTAGDHFDCVIDEQTLIHPLSLPQLYHSSTSINVN